MSEEPTLPAATPEPVAAPAAPAKRKPLSPAQWLEIRTRAELGTSRVSELGREFGISSQAVGQHLKDHKITVGSKAASVAAAVTSATASAVAAATATFAMKRAERIEQTREFYYKAHEIIDGQILKKIAGQITASKPISEIGADIKVLNFAKRALLVGRSERFHVLDVDTHVDPTSLPDLVIKDLSQEEIYAIQKGDDPLEDLEDVLAGVDAASAEIISSD